MSKLINELIQSNLEKENNIKELKTTMAKIDEKASKKETIISYVIGTVVLIITIVQFFI